MADGEQEVPRRTSPRLAAMAASGTRNPNITQAEGLPNRDNLTASASDTSVNLGELANSQAPLSDSHYTQLLAQSAISTVSPTSASALKEELMSWHALSFKLKERAEVLVGTSWRPVVFTLPNMLVEAWVYTMGTGPRWPVITVNGGVYTVTMSGLLRKREEYLMRRTADVYWFEDEIMPSLLDYIYDKRHQEIHSEWGQICHPLSDRLWFAFRCMKCGKERKLKTEHARTVLKCIPRDKRRCEALGLECHTPLSDTKYSPTLKTMEACLPGEPLPMIPEDGGITPWANRGEARTPASRQGRGEGHAFAWTPQPESNVVSILKALGKQGVSIKPYNGTGGGGVLQAWQEALQRHFRLFDLKGDDDQITFASCFLEGDAREWWENLNVSGQIREISSIDDLVHHLRVHFKPLHEDIKLSLEWRQTHQSGDVNSYKRSIFQLQTQFPLGEVAEFCMAYHGLKKELRSPILAELWKRNVRHLPLPLLFELAAQAEVVSPNASSLFPRFAERLREETRKPIQTQGNTLGNKQGGLGATGVQWGNRPVTTWTPMIRQPLHYQRQENKPNYVGMNTNAQIDRSAGTALNKRTADYLAWLKQRPCWICDKTGHLNQECPKKKDRGCMRCGGTHTLRECPQRPKTVSAVQTQGECLESQELLLEEILKEEDRIRGEEYMDKSWTEYQEETERATEFEEDVPVHDILEVSKRNWLDALKYLVTIKGKHVEVMIDTGAQLSLINKETALRCNLKWGDTELMTNVNTANGQAMKILGKIDITITKDGKTKEAEVFVSENLQQQMILGLPWIRRYAPTIEWNSLTLNFNNGEEIWNPTDQIPRCLLRGKEPEKYLEDYVLVLVKGFEQVEEGFYKEDDNDNEEDIPEALRAVLENEAAVFKPLQGIPPESRIKHTIETAPGCRPVMKRPYRMSEQQDKEIEEQIRDALRQGWLRPSYSNWGTAIFPVKKKTGEWRMCTDYRDLNALTELDAYPLPRIDDILHKVARGKIFSTLDLQKGYHQIQIDESDRHKTAFRICRPVEGSSHFEWTVMPFGLKNAPPTFQRYMSLVLKDCTDCCDVYMDDIIIYSRDMNEHAKDLARVLQALNQAQLKVRKSKCSFGQERVQFLGHELYGGKIWMQPTKQQEIVDWPTPLTTARQVRQFLGLASYYRNYVPGFATIAAPLIDLTRKKKHVQWTWGAEQAVKQIKAAIAEKITRTSWDTTLPTRVTTDASGTGLGAVLEQCHPEEGWLTVAVWSRVLNPCQKNYSVLDKEWLAILEVVTRVWRHWLTGKAFEIHTDHGPLVQMLTKKVEDLTPRQLRWLERLEPFTYEMVYIKGKENLVADALSRKTGENSNKLKQTALEIAYIEWGHRSSQIITVEDLQEGQKKDDLYAQAMNDEEVRNQLQVELKEGMLKTTTNQIWVPFDRILRFKLVLEHHDQPCMGHWGVRKTLALLERNFFWPTMIQDVREVVETCDICQRMKIQRDSDAAPIRFIEAQYPWEVVTIDFVSGFKPTKRRHSAIVVVCDRYTRMIHLEPCNDHPTAKETAKMVMRMIFARHGCPRVILSDRGTQFDSELWQHLWNMMGTRVHLASTHHPQTNGLTERMNRTLIDLIRKTTSAVPHHWEDMLPLFEFAYNQTPNATTGAPPFLANHGYLPPTPAALLAAWTDTAGATKGVQDFIDSIKTTYSTIHDIIDDNERLYQEQVRRRHKHQRRKGLDLEEGDEVLMYWPPFEQYNPVPRKHRLRYAGPFTVKRVITDACVQLEGLPERMPETINVEYLHKYFRPISEELQELYGEQAP